MTIFSNENVKRLSKFLLLRPSAKSVSVETLVSLRVTWECIAESESDAKSGFKVLVDTVCQFTITVCWIYYHSVLMNRRFNLLFINLHLPWVQIFSIQKLKFVLRFHFYPPKKAFSGIYLAADFIFVSYLFISPQETCPS